MTISCPTNYRAVTFGVLLLGSRDNVISLYQGSGIDNTKLIFNWNIKRLRAESQNITMCLQNDIYFVNTDFIRKMFTRFLNVYVDAITLPVYSFYHFRKPSFLFSTSVVFSKYSHFLISDAYHPDWLSPTMNDEEWGVGIVSPAITFYYRGYFSVSSEDRMIAFLISYTGGFAAYVNGVSVARFDLPEAFTSETLGEACEEKFEYFTIPTTGLSSVSVLSIEVHAPSADSPHFLRVESFPLVDPDAPIFHSLDIILEDGTVFHNPSLIYDYNVFRINANLTEYISFKFVNRVNINLSSIEPFPSQLLHLRYYHVNSSSYEEFPDRVTSVNTHHPIVFQYDKIPLDMIIFRLRLHYKSQSESTCEVSSELGMIEEGSIVIDNCPVGMLGSSLYECVNKQLILRTEKSCAYPPPGPLVYSSDRFVFYLGLYGESSLPEYTPTITEYTIFPAVDIPGLSFNHKTGQFVGTPSGKSKTQNFIIGGRNPDNIVASTFHVSIEVREAICVNNGTLVDLNEILVELSVWDGCYYGKIYKMCVYKDFELNMEEVDRKCYISIIEICVLCIIVALSVGSLIVIHKNKKRLPIVSIV